MRTSWDVGVKFGDNIRASTIQTHSMFHRIQNVRCRGTHYGYTILCPLSLSLSLSMSPSFPKARTSMHTATELVVVVVAVALSGPEILRSEIYGFG